MLFSSVAVRFFEVEKTSSRLSMSSIVASMLSEVSPDEAKWLVYLMEGNVAPAHTGLELGIGEKLVIRAIAKTSGFSEKAVEADFKKSGDLGLTAEKLLSKKTQLSLSSTENSLEKVYLSFEKMAKLSGSGSQEAKISLLCELLNGATPLEAKYLVRFCLGKLRLGIGDPSIIDALSMLKSGDKRDKEKIERAFNLCSDLGEVAKAYLSGQDLSAFSARPFNPIRPALAERLPDPESIMEKLGGRCAVEAKYDGLRLQVHLCNGQVAVYSRKLERMDGMFPEIEDACRKLKASSLIFEGEALAYSAKEKKFFSFQQTIQRKRKHDVGKVAEELPLKLFAFDIMYLDGKDLTLLPYISRREILEKTVSGNEVIVPSDMKIVESPSALREFFERAASEGLEGVIAKDLAQPYIAGARKFAWIKFKKSYGAMADSIDAVIVGYYLGKGARKEFKFGGVLAAVLNEETGRLETIAKIGGGFSEEEMVSLQKALHKIREKEKPAEVESLITPDFWVKPLYVISVASDEITLSPMHTCGMKDGKGYALRFPRMVSIRADKSVKDITTVKEIISMHEMQKGKESKS